MMLQAKVVEGFGCLLQIFPSGMMAPLHNHWFGDTNGQFTYNANLSHPPIRMGPFPFQIWN